MLFSVFFLYYFVGYYVGALCTLCMTSIINKLVTFLTHEAQLTSQTIIARGDLLFFGPPCVRSLRTVILVDERCLSMTGNRLISSRSPATLRRVNDARRSSFKS